MAYIAVQINVPGLAIGDANNIINGESGGGNSTKPHEALNNLKVLLDAIDSMQHAGTVAITTSTTVVSNSGASGGNVIVVNLV